MANGVQTSVDFGVKLQVLQSSVDDLQKILDRLTPNTAGFNKINKIIKDMRREMENFQVQTSRAFSSQQQFDKASKSIEKMENTLARAEYAVEGLKFKDIKVPDAQMESFRNLDKELQKIESDFKRVKDAARDTILSKQGNQDILNSVGVNLSSKDFDTIARKLDSEVSRLNQKAYEAQQKLATATNTQADKTTKIRELTSNGINEKSLGEDIFNKFFEVTKNNITRFKTMGFGKGEVKKQFLEALKSEFKLTEKDIQTLVNEIGGDQTFANFNKAFMAMGKGDGGATNIFSGVSAKLANSAAQAKKEADEAISRRNSVLGLSNEFNAQYARDAQGNAIGELAKETDTYTDAIARNIQAKRDLERATINEVSTDQTYKASKDALKNGLRSFTEQLQQTNAEFLRLQQAQQTFNSIKTAITNFMGFNQVLNLTKRAVTEAMNHIKQLDATMNGIAIVTDMTTSDLWKQIDTYSKVAQTYGTTIQGAYEVSKIYYQAGYETNDVLTLMNETLKLSKVSGLDYAAATDYMMTATRGFHMEISEAAKVVDVYSALAANTAVSQEELAVAMSKTASSMEGVGATFEETSSMIATMVAVTRESATNIGSALKSIASRYGELTKDPKALFDAEGDAMSFNKVDEALKSVGISLQTADHQFRDFTDVILELSDAWSGLESAQQRYIATQFAGNRQQSRFLALVSNKELLQQNMNVAAESEDTGTLQALKALDSLESKLNQVQVAYQQFYTSIGAENLWKALLDGSTNFINSLNNLPKLFNKVPLGAIAVITNTLSLIKSILLNGLTTIGTQWKDILNKTNSESNTKAQQGGETIGHTWVGSLISAIKSGQNEVQQVMKETVEKGTKQAVQSSQNSSSSSNNINQTDLLNKINTFGSKYSNQRGASVNQEAILEGEDLYEELERLGKLNDQQAKELNNMLDANNFSGFANYLKELVGSFNQLNPTVEKSTGKFKAFTDQLKNKDSNWSRNLTGVAQTLTTIGMLLDKSSKSGRIFSGIMTGIGGALQAGIAGVRVFSGDLSALPQLAMGVLNFVNGISIGWEDDKERLERLTEEAENLANESKKAKAEYNTIQRTADKLDDLKAKRYESVEAEQAYQEAVDELAEKLPNLITGMDDMGNIIIETSNLEYELEKARRAAADATLAAAKAERIKAEEELAQAEKNKNKIYNNFNNDRELLAKHTYDFSGQDLSGLSNYGMLTGLYRTDPNLDATSTEKVIVALKEILEENGIKAEDAGIINGRIGLFRINDPQALRKALDTIPEEIEPYQELINSLLNASDNIEKYNKAEEISKRIRELEWTDEADLKTQLEDISNSIISSGLTDYFDYYIGQVNLYTSGLKSVEELKQSLKSSEKLEISGRIKQLTASETAFINAIGEGETLITNWLQARAEAVGDYSEYVKEGGQIEEDLQLIKDSLDINQWKQFNELWTNRDQFTAKDWRVLIKDAGEEFYEAIDDYYADWMKNARESMQKRLQENFGVDFDSLNINSFIGRFSGFISNENRQFSTSENDYLNNILTQYGQISGKGFTSRAEAFGNRAMALYTSIQKVPEAIQGELIKTILENGLNTKEGIEKTLKSIQDNKDVTNTQVDEILKGLEEIILENIPLTIQTITSEFVGSWDDIEKELTKAVSGGLSISEVDTFISKAKALGIKLDLDKDFKRNGEKLVLTSEALDDYWTKLNENVASTSTSLQSDIDKASEVISGLSVASKLTEEQKELISTIAPNFDYDKYTSLGLLTYDGIIALRQAVTDSQEGLDYYNKLSQIAADNINKQNDWSNGKYMKYLGGRTLTEVASSTTLTKDDADARAIKQKVNSAFNSLISDAIEKGLDNINLADYEGLPAESELKINTKQSLIDFIKQYAAYAGYSAKQTNAEIIKALQKENEPRRNIMPALTTITKAQGDITEAQINALATALNIEDISDFIAKYFILGSNGTYTAKIPELEAYVKEAGDITEEEFTQYVKDIIKNNTISLSNFFKASNRQGSTRSELKDKIKEWNKKRGGSSSDFVAENYIKILEGGGQYAVNLVKLINPNATAEELAEAFKANVTAYQSAFTELSNGIENGSVIINDKLRDILDKSGYDISADGVVVKVGDAVEAYKLIYSELEKDSATTVKDLNNIVASILSNNDEQQAIDALGDAAEMTYTRFGEILAKNGVKMTELMVRNLEDNGVIKGIGGNKMRILDFAEFARNMGWDQNSEAYVSAFKSYNDSLIEINRKTERNIVEEAKKVMDAKPGDLVNITELTSKLGETATNVLNSALKEFGAQIDDGILNIGNNGDIISISQEIITAVQNAADITANEKAELLDTFAQLMDDSVDLIVGGIQGKLSEVQVASLRQIADSRGISLDFTRTTEGLKLSSKAARDLYLSLRDADSVRAKLVFDELAKSLEETDENYRNISTTTARIAELERELANPKVSTARREEYRKELEVAKEIQETRSLTDEGEFNFMERALPTGMQNPIDYWQGTYSAFEAMNKAGENGYMSIQDFYNIVQEMNNMAKEAGSTVEFMGETLDGSLTSASKLVQKGMNAIANIDDVGPAISLERFGNEFKGGAADMQKGIDDGVKTMAKSQIKMLDAMIAFLETIVAMDKFNELDKNNNGLEFGEVFHQLEDGTWEATQGAKETAANILELAKSNTDLMNGLQNVKINGESIYDIMQKITTQTFDTQEEAEKYYKVLSVMAKAAANGDFSTESLTSLIQEAFKGTEELVEVEVFDRKFAIKGDIVLEKSANGKYLVDGQEWDDADKAFAAMAFKEEENLKKVSEENGDLVGTIDVTDNVSINVRRNLESGETTYNVNNTPYHDKIKAVKAAIALERGDDASSPVTEEELLEYDLIAKFNLTRTQVENLTGKPITELSDDVLEQLGVNTALVASIQKGITDALKEIDLGSLILDGLINKKNTSGKIAGKIGDFSDNPQLIELGRQLGVGISKAFTTGSADSFQGWGADAVNQFITGFGSSSNAGTVSSQLLATIKPILTGTDMTALGTASALVFSNAFGSDSNSSIISEKITAPIKTAIQALFTKETLEQLVKDFETNSVIKLSFDSIDVGKLTETVNTINQFITNLATSAAEANKSVSALKDSMNAISENGPSRAVTFKDALNDITYTSVNNARMFTNALESISSNGPTYANEFRNAVNNLRDRSDYAWGFVNAVNDLRHGRLTITISDDGTHSTWWSWAKGNVDTSGLALAKGKKKLMGELGPELVVSHGRYFVVGQNGAEMVDLDDDAIVFNHLQTKKLLSSGSTGRGTPVTTEQNAVAYAGGNIPMEGIALASAAQTLATLKELRAMWQSMLTASAKQLGSTAGISKTKYKVEEKEEDIKEEEKNGVSIKTTTAEIQRWYNLLRQIDKITKDISYQSSLINKYQNDRIANGEKIYKAYEDELKLLDSQIQKNTQLASIQKSWYDIKRQELAQSAYGKIFTYTADGLQQYVDGQNRGLDILEKLNEQNVYGRGVNNAESARSQLAYLQSIGFDLRDLNYGSGGKAVNYIASLDEMYDENYDRLEGQDLMNAQVSLMENFWSKVDGWRDELDELYDSYREQQEQVIENQIKQNEILQQIADNQMEVENAVLQAIEESRQAQIDALQDERDAYEESTNRMIDGLNKALTTERRIYQSNENKNDLTKMERQLAILIRTGGSAAQIKNLQDQINSKQQDLYFESRQQEIDVIKDAAEEQIKRLDQQIALMTETLEYEKNNGLLWEDVYAVMSKSEAEILAYITDNGAHWESESVLAKEKEANELLQKIQIWTGYRDSATTEIVKQLNNSLAKVGETVGSNISTALTLISNRTADWKQETDIAIKGINDRIDSLKDSINSSSSSSNYNYDYDYGYDDNYITADSVDNNYYDTSYSYGDDYTSSSSSGGGGSSYWGEGSIVSGFQYYTYSDAAGHGKGMILADARNGASYKIMQVSGDKAQITEVYDNGRRASQFDGRWITYKGDHRKYKQYEEGGLADYTGLAWLDGTPTKPESILNSEQTKWLRDNLDSLLDLNSSNILLKIIDEIRSIRAPYSNYSTDSDGAINIEHVELNMNVSQLADSYDARRAGKDIMDEIVRIARKTGKYNGLRR